MAYDSPKAVHFHVFVKGNLLPRDSESGLRMRWHIAQKCREKSVCMMRMSDRDRVEVECVLNQFNTTWAHAEAKVQLADNTIWR